MATISLPSVASLWVGSSLGWIENLCLASFVAQGHPTILYSYGKVDNVPEGVSLRDAKEIWDAPEVLFSETSPSYIADIFRLYLMCKSDQIWVDTDVICISPLTPCKNGYLFGHTAGHAEINNAILRLPKESGVLASLIEFIENTDQIPQWLRPALRQRVERAPPEDRTVARFLASRTVLGPNALTYFMRRSDEIKYAAEPDVLYPVPWQFLDVMFNPYGGHKGWVTERTKAVHLWSYMLKWHKKSTPHPDSLVGGFARRLGIDLSELK